MPRPRRTPRGKFLAGGHAVIILRNTGQVITHATVGEKEFRVKTADLGTLKFEISKIQSIVYKNLPTYPVDVLRTIGGSEINGEVLNDPVKVEAADLGGNASLSRSSILSIVF